MPCRGLQYGLRINSPNITVTRGLCPAQALSLVATGLEFHAGSEPGDYRKNVALGFILNKEMFPVANCRYS